jgi:hypothetical protein
MVHRPDSFIFIDQVKWKDFDLRTGVPAHPGNVFQRRFSASRQH